VSKYDFRKIAGIVGVITLLCVLPFFLREFHVQLAIRLFINLILTVSFYLIATTGEISLAHVVMMGVGAYGSALLTTDLGWPVWASIPVAGLIAAGVGRGIHFPLVRMTGFGFFIGSYAAGEAIRLMWMRVRNPFGGVRGLINIPPPEVPAVAGLPAIDFGQAIPFYFLAMGTMLGCLYAMYRIDKSRIGMAFRAIHSDPLVAESIGIRVPAYRTKAFVIACFFAGIAGALLAHNIRAIDPYDFSLTEMTYLLIWAVAGGMYTFWGPVIGVTTMTAVFEGARPLVAWRPFLFGAILISFLLFMPTGLEGIPARVRPLFRRLRSRLRGE